MGITTVSLCEAFADWQPPALDGGPLCGEPSAATVTAACPHEHVNTRPVCAGCAVDLQRGSTPADPWTCEHCAESADPHDCIPLVRIDWDGGERTIVQQPYAQSARNSQEAVTWE